MRTRAVSGWIQRDSGRCLERLQWTVSSPSERGGLIMMVTSLHGHTFIFCEIKIFWGTLCCLPTVFSWRQVLNCMSAEGKQEHFGCEVSGYIFHLCPLMWEPACLRFPLVCRANQASSNRHHLLVWRTASLYETWGWPCSVWHQNSRTIFTSLGSFLVTANQDTASWLILIWLCRMGTQPHRC